MSFRRTNSEHRDLLRLRDALGRVLADHADGRKVAEARGGLTGALADGRTAGGGGTLRGPGGAFFWNN